MDVAIMFSGGKDSTFAIAEALKKGWNIKYLLSVKPTRTDCYLYHFATVEFTNLQAESLGLRHILVSCSVADPKQEAQIVRKIVEKNPVEAIILGGVGLQETQIKSIREAVFDMGVKVFAAHEGIDHAELVEKAIAEGYEIMLAAVASDGLDQRHLGLKLNKQTFPAFKKLSEKYGFHIGGEGGYYDTFVTDGPIFSKAVELVNPKVVWNNDSGYLQAESAVLKEKVSVRN